MAKLLLKVSFFENKLYFLTPDERRVLNLLRPFIANHGPAKPQVT
jgi:hypothetical protein